MGQTANARVSFGDIMQAVADQLLADEIVNDPAQVVWGNPKNIPQFSGPFDVLLVARNGRHEGRDGGGGQLQMLRMIDVWYRSEAVQDPGGGYKAWLTETFEAGDTIIDSIADDDFWPEDDDGNLLTIESIKLVGDVEPAEPKPGAVYGDYVCTIACLYFPATTMKGVHPLP